MSRYLVSGAFGHIGAYLLRQLLAEGHQIVALVRSSSSPWRVRDLLADRNLTVVTADLSDFDSVRSAVVAAAPDVVIHSAWEGVTGAARNDPAQISRNIRFSMNLFDATVEAGCRTFASIGSQAEYGTTYVDARREEMPPRPTTAYGVAKVCVQTATEAMARLCGMRYLWFRVFSVYGPQDDDQHMLPKLIRGLLQGERPSLTGGEQRWDYLYIEDVASAIVACVTTSSASGIYNIASGHSPALRDMVQEIRDAIDRRLPLGFGEVPYQPDQTMALTADISRLKEATGWQPQFDWRDGLERTLEYYRRHPLPESKEGFQA